MIHNRHEMDLQEHVHQLTNKEKHNLQFFIETLYLLDLSAADNPDRARRRHMVIINTEINVEYLKSILLV